MNPANVEPSTQEPNDTRYDLHKKTTIGLNAYARGAIVRTHASNNNADSWEGSCRAMDFDSKRCAGICELLQTRSALPILNRDFERAAGPRQRVPPPSRPTLLECLTLPSRPFQADPTLRTTLPSAVAAHTRPNHLKPSKRCA